MAQITFNIPDASLQRIIDAFASEINMYSSEISNPDYNPDDPNSTPTISNPVTPAQFTKQEIIRFIKNTVINAERYKIEQGFKTTGDEINAINIS